MSVLTAGTRVIVGELDIARGEGVSIAVGNTGRTSQNQTTES